MMITFQKIVCGASYGNGRVLLCEDRRDGSAILDSGLQSASFSRFNDSKGLVCDCASQSISRGLSDCLVCE